MATIQLKNIKKEYRSSDNVVTALKGINLSFRENEFVAILGPSGSGKTTLLNIIGGLDRYSEGDLIIDNKSTKNFNDRDWDTYRNHTIGFVFQSYNLIPHQTVLANVELAMTISGVSKEERRQKAIDALVSVGLKDHIYKKPNQLSGGQMQRVAFARALVNDPYILLADEPTGALDSESSVQVMNLIKEVSKDRLVIMITHNSELAEEYANRIVRIKDGSLIDDTNPYNPEDATNAPSTQKPHIRKSRMTFLSALILSFNNLLTKKGRTLLVSIASSIGIIGIALILSVSNGVNAYISDIEEGTVLQYPITISKMAINFENYSSMMGMDNLMPGNTEKSKDIVTVDQIIHRYAGGLTNNDLKSLKAFIDQNDELKAQTCAIEYTYDVIPEIYRPEKNSIRKVNPEQCLANLGTSYSDMSSIGLAAFFPLPQNEFLYKEQYEIKAGHWPENKNECVVCLSPKGEITDTALYALGLKDAEELDEIVSNMLNNKNVKSEENPATYKYEDFLEKTFKVIPAADKYRFDATNNLWTDITTNEDDLKALYENGMDLKVTGVVQLKEDSKQSLLKTGIYYSPDLVTYLMNLAPEKEVVKAQLADPGINVFTGKPFDDDSGYNFPGMEDLLSFDSNKFLSAFSFNLSGLNNSTDFNPTDEDLKNMEDDYKKISELITFNPSEESTKNLVKNLIDGFKNYAPGALFDKDYFKNLLSDYLKTDAAKNIIIDFVKDVVSSVLSGGHIIDLDNLSNIIINPEQLNNLAANLSQGFVEYASDKLLPDSQKFSTALLEYLNTDEAKNYISDYVNQTIDQETAKENSKIAYEIVKSRAESYLTNFFSEHKGDLVKLFNIDENQLLSAFGLKMSESELTKMISSFLKNSTSSYSNNLTSLGYGTMDAPNNIDIYSKDFAAKEKIQTILDKYNYDMKQKGETDKVVTYTDIAGVMMNSVTDIINVITIVLIAVVLISLIVSSIMISVITHISVMERRKEIGILRAIGASKGNIASIFNAETFITGLLSGAIGITATLLLLIPLNYGLHSLIGIEELSAYMKPTVAILLILLSIGLNVFSGLIPAHKASKSDPVEALRSE